MLKLTTPAHQGHMRRPSHRVGRTVPGPGALLTLLILPLHPQAEAPPPFPQVPSVEATRRAAMPLPAIPDTPLGRWSPEELERWAADPEQPGAVAYEPKFSKYNPTPGERAALWWGTDGTGQHFWAAVAQWGRRLGSSGTVTVEHLTRSTVHQVQKSYKSTPGEGAALWSALWACVVCGQGRFKVRRMAAGDDEGTLTVRRGGSNGHWWM